MATMGERCQEREAQVDPYRKQSVDPPYRRRDLQ